MAILKAVTLAILVFVPVMFLLNRLEAMPRSTLLINRFVLMALHGAALGGMSLAIWALLTDAVQRSLAAGGEGEASAVGLFLAVLKTAAALGNLAFAGIVAAGPVRLATTAVGDIALLPACATVLPLLGCLAAGGLLWRGGNAASLSR